MRETIKKYRNKDFYNYNCSEAILYAANEYYDLNLDANSFKMMSGFGGGIYEKHLCGIVSGCVAVLGILFKDKNTKEYPVLETSINELKAKFRSMFGKIECDYLKQNHADEINGCNDIIIESALILKDVVDRYQ